jgi:hypothetical protein
MGGANGGGAFEGLAATAVRLIGKGGSLATLATSAGEPQGNESGEKPTR